MFHYVNFHADGGTRCLTGLRRFTDAEKADAFAALMRREPGHDCPGRTVDRFSNESLLQEYGIINVADEHRAQDGNFFYAQALALTTNEPTF